MSAVRSIRAVGVVLAGVVSIASANAQARPVAGPQSFSLTDLNDLVTTGGKMETVEYMGRKAVRLTTLPSKEEVFAFLKGVEIQDGTIEADIALKTTTPPGVRMPGFVGIAFRARADASHYEMFYLRPGNAHSEDQGMRNHSAQYVTAGHGWYELRKQWPWVYEAYAELRQEQWNKVKIEVHGRSAKLFINGSENPNLIVDGLKGEDLRGGVALWGYAGEEAYFSNVRVTPAEPQAVTNDGEASGSWAVEFASDYGKYKGSMDLHREGGVVTGTWSGDFGNDRPIRGTWRDGYVELGFDGAWPKEEAPVKAILAGWVDGDSAKGRMRVEGRADGQWTALRKK